MTAAAAVIDRTNCAGTRHGTRTAYKANGCRCPDALADKRRRDKAYAAGIAPSGLVPILGSARRLQALAAIGWDAPRLAEHLNAHEDWIGKVRAAANPYITRGVANQIARLYERLQGTPGPSLRARAWAARYQWAAPLAWEDDIDDPDAAPCAAASPRRHKRPRTVDNTVVARLVAGHLAAADASPAERVAAISRLTADGWSAQDIAHHIGMHPRSVKRLRGRVVA